ncbi:class I SAM-dependent methyltransferase [Enhygromyxa salina]|uniref:class I SAM-dependent methyltransferase n=1 Tax=Enhygromyxa salina TaxID=215803 RepID=UPI0015E5C852|nr:class I SAM-dependent methyltransferase [Enhygromyxa salina]
MSGSTKRPEQDPANPHADPRSDHAAPPVPEIRAAIDGLERPIDLRARVVSPRHVEPQPADSSARGRSPSTSATGPFRLGSAWSRLIDSLVGDVILTHIPGQRVLDLGYGSPELSEWVEARVGEHLSIVEKGALEHPPSKIVDASGFLPASEFLDADGKLMIPEDDEADGPALSLAEYADASFDVVYCVRTFPHLGYDTESSERLGRQLLREAARVTVDGGTVFVQIANPRSLRGIVEGIRNPITVVSRRRMILGDRYGLTRWDTISRFLRFLPPELELGRFHGLGVMIPHNATLQLPVVGRVLSRLEWRLRDLAVVRRFGAQMLIVLRRLHRSDPTLAEGGRPRASLSASLREALSSSTRSLGKS